MAKQGGDAQFSGLGNASWETWHLTEYPEFNRKRCVVDPTWPCEGFA